MTDNTVNNPDDVEFTMNKRFLENLYTKMLTIIFEWFPSLSVQRKKEMVHNVAIARLVTFNRGESSTVNVNLFSNNMILARFSVPQKNEILDFVPIIKDGFLHNIDPVIILDENACLHTIIHELAHLLSLGGYHESVTGSIYHRFGLLSYQYKIENGRLIRQFYNEEVYTENEIVTNLATAFFSACLFESIDVEKHDGIQKNRALFKRYFNIF